MALDRPRIACVGDFPLGSRRAHAINVVKTAGGFARLGWDVLLLCRTPEPDPGAGPMPSPEHGPDIRSPLDAYAEPTLRVQTLPGPDERTHPPGSDKRCVPMASWAVERAAAFGAQAMYSRLAHAAVAWADVGGLAIAETHAYIGEAKPAFQRLLDATARHDRPVAALSTISHRLREHYVRRGADLARVHVIPDGVDLELFERPASVDDPTGAPSLRESTRAAKHEAPVLVTSDADSRPLAVYAGHLYDYKGIPTILDAAALLPGVRFELIGGLPEDITRVGQQVARRGLSNVTLAGWIDHAALPPRLWRADVLMLPPSAREPSKDWTSPVKLGEYLAAGPPIVASAIPALRDWVDEPVVTWFAPDDADSLSRAIGRALAFDSASDARRRAKALDLARAWSYPSRAAAMLRAGGVLRTSAEVGA